MKDHTDLKIALAVVHDADAAFKVQKLNEFFLTNQTTGQPMLAVVGQAVNNGTEVEDYVDLSLSLFDRNGDIVGTSFLYDDDVKPNDTIPFQFTVPPEAIAEGGFDNVQNYSVMVE